MSDIRIRNPDLPVRVFLVDLGQVLVRFDHGRTLRALEMASGIPAETLRPHVFGPLSREFDLGRLTAEEFFRSVERSAGIPSIPDEVWIPAWRDIFEPDLTALGALARVRRDVTRVLVSNTNPLHWEGVLRIFDVPSLVDHTVLSFETGAAKPEAAIFEAALRAGNAAPHEALFADDRGDYVAAARTFGIPGFVVTGPGVFERSLVRMGLLEPV
ncbi:MAG: HAD family hydrolase [Thermoanaerobaculia bacterium]